MTAEQMHYMFKLKTDKVDSQQNRNWLIPEIDVLLNEAQLLFIKHIAEPRTDLKGFESNQRNIDDIKEIVEKEKLNVFNNTIDLPSNYLFYVNSTASGEKGSCSSNNIIVNIRRHEELFEENSFTKSSFEWRIVNGVFRGNSIVLFNKDFTINNIELIYIRKPKYIHLAEKFGSGSYLSLNGETLTGKQDCELSEQTHGEIVDLAVYLAMSAMTQNINEKINKIKINNK